MFQNLQNVPKYLCDLGRKVFENVLLHPAEQEGQRLSMERLHGQSSAFLFLGRGLGVPTGQNGLAVTRLELLLAAQESGHEEVEQRPQFQHVVLDGRSREDEPVIGDQLLDGLGRFRLAVLDHVTLVQNAVVPAQGGKKVDVVADDVVRGDDQIVARDSLPESHPLRRRSGVMQRIQVLGADEFLHFVDPVTRQCGRADDDGRKGAGGWVFRLAEFRLALMVVSGQNANRLQRLAQTHVVAEDSVQAVLVEEGQPIDSVLLIGTQFRIDRNGHLIVLQFLRIEKLFQERTLLHLPLGQFGAEGRRIGYSSFQRHQAD